MNPDPDLQRLCFNGVLVQEEADCTRLSGEGVNAAFGVIRKAPLERAFLRSFITFWKSLFTSTEHRLTTNEQVQLIRDLAIDLLIFMDRNKFSMIWFPLILWWSKRHPSFQIIRRHAEKKFGANTHDSEFSASSLLKVPIFKYRMWARNYDDYMAVR
ncbi:MAG: hypothetical protein IPH91_05175 [Elusimicrobia bacterium]|nr:hypothetical protein [Elusimicrobiota bacterium]